MHGGMRYSEHKLISVLGDFFDIIELRQMNDVKENELLGLDMLWTVLAKKK